MFNFSGNLGVLTYILFMKYENALLQLESYSTWHGQRVLQELNFCLGVSTGVHARPAVSECVRAKAE